MENYCRNPISYIWALRILRSSIKALNWNTSILVLIFELTSDRIVLEIQVHTSFFVFAQDTPFHHWWWCWRIFKDFPSWHFEFPLLCAFIWCIVFLLLPIAILENSIAGRSLIIVAFFGPRVCSFSISYIAVLIWFYCTWNLLHFQFGLLLYSFLLNLESETQNKTFAHKKFNFNKTLM